MTRLSVRLLASVLAVALAASWLVLLAADRAVSLPLASAVTLLVLAAALLLWGLRVRRLRDGDRRAGLDRSWGPITAAMAQSTAVVGAGSVGWHALTALEQASLLAVRDARWPLWLAVLQIAVGAVLVVVGWIVESWCSLPPDDPEEDAAVRGGAPKLPQQT